MDFMEAIRLYRETFNEGPPVYGMEEDEAIKRMQQAIESGEKMTEGAEVNIPDGAIL